MLTCTGAAILFGWKEFFAPATIVAAFGGHWGNLIARCIMRLDRLADGDCHSPHDAVLSGVLKKTCGDKRIAAGFLFEVIV